VCRERQSVVTSGIARPTRSAAPVRDHERRARLFVKGRIAVVVLHDLIFAARWADNIIVMENGRLHNAGPPTAAITPAMLASVYGVDCRVER
jgi:ABC-type hemin transport system ATPase subunit